MALQREVLPDRPEVRQEDLRTPRIAEATHATLPLTCGLVTVFGSVIQPSAGFDEDMFDVRQLGDLGFRGGIATQLAVTILRGTSGHAARSRLKNRLAAALSRRFCSKTSSSAPCWSTARHNR